MRLNSSDYYITVEKQITSKKIDNNGVSLAWAFWSVTRSKNSSMNVSCDKFRCARITAIIFTVIIYPSVLNSRGKKTKQDVNDCNGGLLGGKSA